MKTLVVYGSVYGNTKTIAEAIATAIPGEVDLLKADEALEVEPGAYDLLVVGAPTHGGRPPEAVQTFLNQIQAPALKGIKVAGFDTRVKHFVAKLFGYAAPRIVKALEKKGGIPVGVPGDFYVAGTEGPLLEGEVERATQWARGLAGSE